MLEPQPRRHEELFGGNNIIPWEDGSWASSWIPPAFLHAINCQQGRGDPFIFM